MTPTKRRGPALPGRSSVNKQGRQAARLPHTRARWVRSRQGCTAGRLDRVATHLALVGAELAALIRGPKGSHQ